MAKQTRREIYITCNGKSADDMIRTLTDHAADLDAQIKKLIADGKGSTKECKELVSVSGQLHKQLKQNISDTEMIDKVMKNLAGSATAQLRKALQAVNREISRSSEESGKLPQLREQYEALKAQIDKNTGAIHKQGGAWQTAMKNLTAYVGLFSLFNKAKELVTGAIKKNFEYSGSLTDIRKVSGLTMDQVKQLSVELAKIDTRTSVDGLAQLAYQGAKLGMSKYGVEGMAQFVKAADKINVALGEELGEEALPALSKMVEVMGLIPKMGIEKAMDATGSAMFKLSTTSTATSNDIVEFSKRLTGVARTAGITTDQLLALGSASSSMMLMPEVASTAFGKFITALQKNHNLIAKELGIPDETIKNLYASGHAMDAMVLVFEKMRDKGNMNALGSMFKDLGSDGQRLVTAMVTMAKNVDMLKDHLYESEEAFREATAVTNEYEMQQQSAIGILERANNLWEKAFVYPEGVDAVKEMAEWWYEMSKTMTSSPLLKGTLLVSLQLVLMALKAVATLLPVIIGYIASQGIYSGFILIKNLGAAFVSAVQQMYAYITATRTATAAQTGLNTAMKLNPWVALASVIIAVVGAVYGYAQQAKEAAKAEMDAAKKANEWKNNLKEAQSETDTTTRKLHSYKVAMEKLNLSQAERSRQISQFNKDFRPYISNLGIEIKSVDDLRKNYKALAEEIQRATYYRLREKAKEDAMPKFQMDRLNAENRIKNALKYFQSRGSGFTSKGIMEMFAKGANANWIYQQIIKGDTPNVDDKGINFDVKTGRYSYTTKSGAKVSSSGNQELLSALRHYQNATARERNKEKEINDYFGDFVPEDYYPWIDEEPGTLEIDASDKDAARQAKQEKRDRERAWREELKQKQDQAKAIMDDVDNYYDRQINAKLAQAISLHMDEAEQKQFVLPLKQNKEIARSQVRLAVAGQPNKWEDAKEMMTADMVEQADETGVNLSKDLLDGILNNNIENLRKLMKDLGDSLGLSMNSITAQIFAKATRSEQEILKMQFKQMEARRKIAMEHDYTGIVQQNSYDNFNEMGYAAPTKEETTVTKKVVSGKEVLDNSAFEKRKKIIKEMFEAARRNIAQLYTIDVTTTNGQGMLMKMLFGDDPDGMAARIKESLGESEDSWKAFYQNLIQYSDDYAEAEKKKYDSAKKIVNFWWSSNKRNLAQQDKLRKIENESQMFGKRTNLLSNLGLADLTADPEIELMKARMQAAEDYYAFVERNTKNKQLIDEAERARQEAELAYANQMATAMKNRLLQMKELVQPIEDFGAAVGQALAEMKNDAESANEAIKSALKSMLESWGKMAVNDVNTQMWKAINDAAAKRGRANAQPDIDAARANAKASYTDFKGFDWRNFGTESKPLWVRWKGDHYEDKSGNAVYVKEDGTPLPNPDGSVPQSNEPPRAWKKRHPDGTIDDYNKEVAAFGGQIGSAAVDVATGNSSMDEAAAGIAMSGANALFNANIEVGKKDNKDKKNRNKELRDEKKHQKDLADIKKKGVEAQEKVVDKGQENMTQTTKEGSEEQKQATLIAQNAMLAGTQQALTTAITAKKDTDNEAVESEADSTEKRMNLSLAGAVAKCFDFLGPIAGPIAAAVVTATLNGLLQWAISSAFSSKKSSSSKGPNTRVVSGMLTYDSGNVQDLKPFVANDGSLYWATEDNKPHNGVSLITKPTATTINGRSALVAENGPELVIGRETTRAMMMNNPQLMKALVNYDRNYSGRRAYDAGNVAESSSKIASGTPTPNDVGVSQADTNLALLQAIGTLMQRLNEPIEARIDMYGRGNLYDSMTKANQFMKRK